MVEVIRFLVITAITIVLLRRALHSEGMEKAKRAFAMMGFEAGLLISVPLLEWLGL